MCYIKFNSSKSVGTLIKIRHGTFENVSAIKLFNRKCFKFDLQALRSRKHMCTNFLDLTPGVLDNAGYLVELVLVLLEHVHRQLWIDVQPLDGQRLLRQTVHRSAKHHQLRPGRFPARHLQVHVVDETAARDLREEKK